MKHPRHIPVWIAAAMSVMAAASALGQTKAPEASPFDGTIPIKTSLPAIPSWTSDAKLPFVEYKNAWPDRVRVDVGKPDKPEGQVVGKLGVIREIHGEILGWNQRFGFTGPLEVDPEDREDLEFWTKAYGKPVDTRFEGKGAYLVHFDAIPGKKFSQRPKAQDRPVMAFKYISAERDPAIVHPGKPADGTPEEKADEKPRVTIQRTSFVFFEPYADAERMTGVLPLAEARGIALVMPGLFGTPDAVMDVMTRRLRQDRWYVLRLLSASSRFTETATYTFDTSKDTTAMAREMGVVLGNRAAECAYAVEAAFEHVLRERSALRTLPRVVVGGSAGAITLPTVVAREPEKYAAAVLIGGGADFWLINWRSNYRRGVDAIRLRWIKGEPTEADERKVDEAYLQAAALDSFHTAKALHNMPVLMIHGAVDRAVPAALGDLLWERLNRPERKVLQVGHEFLFASVAGELTEISEWMTAAVEGRVKRPVPPAPTPAPEAERVP